jgi:hypothetical protein
MSTEPRSSVRLLCVLGVDLGATNSTIAEAAWRGTAAALLQANSRSLSSSLTMLMVSTAQ